MIQSSGGKYPYFWSYSYNAVYTGRRKLPYQKNSLIRSSVSIKLRLVMDRRDGHRRTQGHGIYGASTALCGKNRKGKIKMSIT